MPNQLSKSNRTGRDPVSRDKRSPRPKPHEIKSKKFDSNSETQTLRYKVGYGGVNYKEWHEDLMHTQGSTHGASASYLFLNYDFKPMETVNPEDVHGPDYVGALDYDGVCIVDAANKKKFFLQPH
jgi:hypothetical protein